MSDHATTRHPHWGFHGQDIIERDNGGTILRLSGHSANVLGVSPRKKIVFVGPPCRVYTYDTMTEEERERLEAEIGAKFVRRACR